MRACRTGWLAVLSIGATTALASEATIYVSPDVATEPHGTALFLPHQIVEVQPGPGSPYSPVPALFSMAAISAVHKLDRAGHWLVSFDAPRGQAHPRDVIRVTEHEETLFFAGTCVEQALPRDADVSALALFPDDEGNLFLSFRNPVQISGQTVLPGAVVEYARTGPGGCDWRFERIAFDLLGAVPTAPSDASIAGLDLQGGRLLVTFDIPVDLAPSDGPATYFPWQVAAFDPATGRWALFEDLGEVGDPGWPVQSRLDALCGEANPGRIDAFAGHDDQIHLDRNGADLIVRCPGSCSSGGRRFGLYRGTLAQLRRGVYDHAPLGCSEACPGDLAVPLTPTSSYYLVTPGNGLEEGSFGLSSTLGVTAERPPGAELADRCAPTQALTPCPSSSSPLAFDSSPRGARVSQSRRSIDAQP